MALNKNKTAKNETCKIIKILESLIQKNYYFHCDYLHYQ